jgi:hypothetical protein
MAAVAQLAVDGEGGGEVHQRLVRPAHPVQDSAQIGAYRRGAAARIMREQPKGLRVVGGGLTEPAHLVLDDRDVLDDRRSARQIRPVGEDERTVQVLDGRVRLTGQPLQVAERTVRGHLAVDPSGTLGQLQRPSAVPDRLDVAVLPGPCP